MPYPESPVFQNVVWTHSESSFPLQSEWTHVKDRILLRSSNEQVVSIYRSNDGSQYLRVGPRERIFHEANLVDSLHQRGFPVPEVLEKGETNGLGYYIETSLGETSFADRFHEEYRLQGKVSDETLSAYCNVMCLLLAAQLNPNNNVDSNSSQLREGIHLADVLNENPDIADKIELCVARVEDKLNGLPIGFTDGDFGPRNTLENGIIDIDEYSFVGPVGYDVLNGATTERFLHFRDSDGKLDFDLTDEQLDYYFSRVDGEAIKHGFEGLSKFKNEFFLLRAIWAFWALWALAHNTDYTDPDRILGVNSQLELSRAVLIYCIDQYLNDRPIDTKQFPNLEKN